MITCLNCGQHFEGNFCGNCGQKANTHRIDRHYVLHEVPHSVFHLESGLLFTIKELLVRPGAAIKGFLAGRRVTLFKPILFLLVMTSVTSLLVAATRHLAHVPSPDSADISKFKFLNNLLDLVSHYPGVTLLILVPFVSLINQWFFRKQRYNYWENIIVNTYAIGNLNCVVLVSKLIDLLIFKGHQPDLVKYFFRVCLFGYMMWVYYQVYRSETRKLWTLVKCILSPVAAFGLIFLIGILAAVVGVLLSHSY